MCSRHIFRIPISSVRHSSSTGWGLASHRLTNNYEVINWLRLRSTFHTQPVNSSANVCLMAPSSAPSCVWATSCLACQVAQLHRVRLDKKEGKMKRMKFFEDLTENIAISGSRRASKDSSIFLHLFFSPPRTSVVCALCCSNGSVEKN